MDAPYQLFCVFVATSGLISYALLIIQLYVYPMREEEPSPEDDVVCEDGVRVEEPEMQSTGQASTSARETTPSIPDSKNKNEEENSGRDKTNYKRQDSEMLDKKQQPKERRKDEFSKEQFPRQNSLPEFIEETVNFEKPKVSMADEEITVEKVDYIVLPKSNNKES